MLQDTVHIDISITALYAIALMGYHITTKQKNMLDMLRIYFMFF